MEHSAEIWQNELKKIANEEKAVILRRFFKTGKGEYGEGDVFIGITVPQNREIAKTKFSLPYSAFDTMLESDIHEFRLSALLALVIKFKKQKDKRKEIVDFYLNRTKACNNWDLVDLSAPYILGEYLLTNPNPALLDSLSRSSNMWEQRIAIVCTLTLIRHGMFEDTLRLAERYLPHSHPLIHKATGWMLREIGKKNIDVLRSFLDKFTTQMPRTALRYAIEKMDSVERTHYMNVK